MFQENHSIIITDSDLSLEEELAFAIFTAWLNPDVPLWLIDLDLPPAIHLSILNTALRASWEDAIPQEEENIQSSQPRQSIC